MVKEITFVKWSKEGNLDAVKVEIHNEAELKEARKQLRGYSQAKEAKRLCSKCSTVMLDYGLVNTRDKGVVRVYRCNDDECENVEIEVVYDKEQVELIKILHAPIKCCNRKMRKTWSYCPYCGEEIER